MGRVEGLSGGGFCIGAEGDGAGVEQHSFGVCGGAPDREPREGGELPAPVAVVPVDAAFAAGGVCGAVFHESAGGVFAVVAAGGFSGGVFGGGVDVAVYGGVCDVEWGIEWGDGGEGDLAVAGAGRVELRVLGGGIFREDD